ncbi:MAG TPA: caspase family protein, partial [Xanthobacteraceae bacterium]|nr:caspase family protein [Xanthobacteraceae bacterium]
MNDLCGASLRSSIPFSIKPAHPFRSFFLAGALLGLGAGPSAAANYALLIGAADYQNPNINKLKGPPNDVTLMWRLLTEKRGFDAGNITVLADGLRDKAGQPRFPLVNGEPKRAPIVAAFAALADKAKSGDLVLIFYSGHGTQQPVKNTNQNPERDNMDQVMLPTDAGDYDEKTQTVRNGIVDDEIGAALDKIRDK